MKFFVSWLLVIAILFGNIQIYSETAFLDHIQTGTVSVITLFCPRDNLKLPLSTLIEHESTSIQIAAYNLTCGLVAQGLASAYKKNVVVEIVTSIDCLRSQGEHITYLWELGIPIYVAASKALLMHHKYVIFSNNIGSRPLVWTGSANLTERGLTKNYENVTVLTQPDIAQDYKADFEWLKDRIRQQAATVITIAQPHKKKCINVVIKDGMILSIAK